MRDRRRQGNASAAAEESGAGALAGNTPTGGLQEMTAGQRCCWGVNVELGLIDCQPGGFPGAQLTSGQGGD